MMKHLKDNKKAQIPHSLRNQLKPKFYYLLILLMTQLTQLACCQQQHKQQQQQQQWNPPSMFLQSTNSENINNQRQIKYNANYIGQLSDDGKINVFSKANLQFYKSFQGKDYNKGLFTDETDKTFIDFDFVQGEDVLAALTKTFFVQIQIKNGEKLKDVTYAKPIISKPNYYQKALINQHSLIFLQQNGDVQRHPRKKNDKYVFFQVNKIYSIFDKNEGQIFVYLSQNTYPSQTQRSILGSSVQYFESSNADYQYIIIKQLEQIVIVQCKINQYLGDSCKEPDKQTYENEFEVGFDISGKNWLLTFQAANKQATLLMQYSMTTSPDIKAFYQWDTNQFQQHWVMDYKGSRSLVLFKNSSLFAYAYGNKGAAQVVLHDYSGVQGFPSPGTITDAFYDIRDEKFYTLSEGVLKSFTFGCTDQVSYYWPVVSCIMCKDQCFKCNNVTGNCIDQQQQESIPQPQAEETEEEQTIIILNDQAISQQVVIPQQLTQQDSIQPEIIQPQKQPQQQPQQNNSQPNPQKPKQQEENIKYIKYMAQEQKKIMATVNEHIDQASQSATYALWTFSALPFSSFFLSFINFWMICSFYAFLEIQMPHFLRKMLIDIFIMINSSLLEFLGIEFYPNLSVRNQQITERLSQNILQNFQISSNFALMNIQNVIICLFSLLLIAIFQFISIRCKKMYKKKLTEAQTSFFEVYLGQIIGFFPFIIISFWMFKSSSSYFRNLSEKINITAYQVSISLIVLVPFLVLSYLQLYRKNNKIKKIKLELASNQKHSLLHKKLEWFYLIQCNVLIPMTALLAFPILSLTLCFGLFGLGFYLAIIDKEKGILRKINQAILHLQLIILNSLFLGIKIAGDYGSDSFQTHLAVGCIGVIGFATVHQILTLIIVDILIDTIWQFIKKIQKSFVSKSQISNETIIKQIVQTNINLSVKPKFKNNINQKSLPTQLLPKKNTNYRISINKINNNKNKIQSIEPEPQPEPQPKLLKPPVLSYFNELQVPKSQNNQYFQAQKSLDIKSNFYQKNNINTKKVSVFLANYQARELPIMTRQNRSIKISKTKYKPRIQGAPKITQDSRILKNRWKNMQVEDNFHQQQKEVQLLEKKSQFQKFKSRFSCRVQEVKTKINDKYFQ